MNYTPEQIKEAQAILDAASLVEYWPKGAHVVSSFGTPSFDIGANAYHRSIWRELTTAELEILKAIPEIAKALEGK